MWLKPWHRARRAALLPWRQHAWPCRAPRDPAYRAGAPGIAAPASCNRPAPSGPRCSYGLVRVRENAESIAFYGGEDNEQRLLNARLRAAVDNFLGEGLGGRGGGEGTSIHGQMRGWEGSTAQGGRLRRLHSGLPGGTLPGARWRQQAELARPCDRLPSPSVPRLGIPPTPPYPAPPSTHAHTTLHTHLPPPPPQTCSRRRATCPSSPPSTASSSSCCPPRWWPPSTSGGRLSSG